VKDDEKEDLKYRQSQAEDDIGGVAERVENVVVAWPMFSAGVVKMSVDLKEDLIKRINGEDEIE
jgi:hypothetical protein